MLEVRAMVYVDVRRDADVEATIARLQTIAQRGDPSAALAEHYVRAYSLYQRDQYAAASAELNRIDMESIATMPSAIGCRSCAATPCACWVRPRPHCRFWRRAWISRTTCTTIVRSLHAMLWLARIYTNTGNFDRASEQLESARRLATHARR